MFWFTLMSLFVLTIFVHETKQDNFFCHPVCEHRCLPTCKLQCCLPGHENPLHRSFIPHPMFNTIYFPINARNIIRHPVMKSYWKIPEEKVLEYILQRRGLIIPRAITPEQLEEGDSCAMSCQVNCRPNCKFRCCLKRDILPKYTNTNKKEEAGQPTMEDKARALSLLLRRSGRK